MANSAPKSQPTPGGVLPAPPAGGARVRIDSKDPDSASTATASTTGWIRTRRCVAMVPERSA